MVDLSIVIVSYNTKGLLRDCLHSIYSSTKAIAFEIFVVDNHSSDNTVQMLREEFPRVILIENVTNKGFASANNQAMKLTNGRNILLLNPDTKVLEHALDNMVKFIDSREDVDALGCQLLYPDMSLQPSCYRFPSFMPIISHILHLWLIPGLRNSRLLSSLESENYDRIHQVDCVRGACLLVKRDVLSRVGYLDEDYFLFTEEIDWCYRMKKENLKVFYYPHSQIVHYRGQSADENSHELFVQRMKSLNLFYLKHFGSIRAFLFRILKFTDTSIQILERIMANIYRRIRGQKVKFIRHYVELQKWLIRGHLS